MKLSYNWLKEYVDITLPAKELGDKLSMAGLVVAGIEEIAGDYVFEFEQLPNRPDWLNVIGIAREISAVCQVNLKKQKKISLKETGEDIKKSIEVVIQSQDLCNRYTARIIKNVKIGQSPEWIADRLKKAGIRVINNVVDITNYVLLEYGHPLHAFDLSKINEKKIIVRNAKSNEPVITLDGVERKLSLEMLVIADAQVPVALAGIIGGKGSEVSESTVDVLLESAYFNPSNIRLSSKKLGVSTEASYRFERGADVDIVVCALDRATQLISEIAGGEVSKGFIDNYPKEIKKQEIKVRPARVQSLMGVEISVKEICLFLNSLGIEVLKKEKDLLTLSIPNFRRDISREEDIAEEVVRLYGYDKIQETLPNIKVQAYEKKPLEIICDKLKEQLVSNGLWEVINYSFVSPDEQKVLGEEGSIYLSHPLADTQSVMRKSLIPGLIRNASFNNNRNKKKCNIFETGKTFLMLDKKIKEEQMFAILVQDDFLSLKGIVENVLDSIGYKGKINFKKNNNVWCQKDQIMDIIIDGVNVGFLGVFDASFCISEISIEKLLNIAPKQVKYKPLRRFPENVRDLAVVVKEDMEYQEITDFIKSLNIPFEFSLELFDVYKGAQVQKGFKSIAFTMAFCSYERTLSDEEVDKVFLYIIDELKSKKDICLRS